MKTLWNIVAILLLLHILLLAGGGLWLWKSDRLDKNRIKQTIALFKPTLAEDQSRLQEAEKAAAEAERDKEEAARLVSVSKGPRSPEDRISADDREDELLRQRLQRLQRERQDLLRQIDMAKNALSRQKHQLDGQRETFEKKIAEEIRLREDQDFQLAVQMYEQVRPKQGKQMMQELIAQGKTDQVIDYLAAMQLRKAAAILKEFKTPAETAQAADLVQHLRKRGIDPLIGAAGAGTQDSPARGANQPADVGGGTNQTQRPAVNPSTPSDAS